MSEAGTRGTAVVSGLSVSGMVSAAILAQAGYSVIAIDRRREFTRGIQWAGRQSLIDELARIEPSLASRFLDVCGPIYLGSTRVQIDGSRQVKPKPFPRAGDPGRLPGTAHDMLEEPACFLVAAVELEKLLRGHLRTLRNLTLRLGDPAQVGGIDSSQRVVLEGGVVPELFVVAEGQSSTSRHRVGIASAATSPARRQMAGQVLGWDNGSMVKRLRSSGGGLLETGTISQRGRGSTWIVGDVGPRGQPAETASRVAGPRARHEFVGMAADVLGEPETRILRRGVWGPSRRDIHPRAFQLRQHLAASASAGRNAVLIGDAVGNGHWNEGGGMQVGAICHAQRLRELIATADASGRVDMEALATYSEGVLEDSSGWGERGITSFYPDVSPHRVLGAYRRAVGGYIAGTEADPGGSIERELANRSEDGVA